MFTRLIMVFAEAIAGTVAWGEEPVDTRDSPGKKRVAAALKAAQKLMKEME